MDPMDLAREIQNIDHNMINKPLKLPVQPGFENLLYIEKTMEVKAYIKGNQIVFIMAIPLVESDLYNYYRLFPAPTLWNETYVQINPTHPYLLLNEHRYLSENLPCTEIIKSEYVCNNINHKLISKDSPCEVQLLRFTGLYEKCKVKRIDLSENLIEHIASNQWLFVNKNKSVIEKMCNKGSDKTMVDRGTYILSVSNNCKIRINNHVLTSHETINLIKRVPEIPLVHLISFPSETESESPPYHYTRIHHNISDIKSQLDILKTDVASIEVPNFHIDSIGIGTIVIYIILVVLIIIIFMKLYKKYVTTPANEVIEKISFRKDRDQINITSN